MRVLAKLSDGSIGFTNKVNFTYIPANTAYLTVPSSTPAEVKLMTQAEYDAYMEEQASKTPVTITAKSYTREYGEENPAFEYSVDGTLLGGTPAISCAATKNSPAGTYPIVVAAGTVKNGTPTFVNGTLTITKAPLTVKANDATKVEQDANPTLTITYSGFKNDDTADVLTKKPTVTTTATAESLAGSYDIVVAGGESDRYNFTYKKGILTVTERPAITITAKSYTREYGEENPTLEYTVTGGTLLGGAPVLSCAATKDSPAGEYEITVATGTVQNIHRTLVAGKLTITKAPLTVKANDASKMEQDENPVLTITYSGFKNDDTAEVLTKQPTATTTATADSPVGTYDITVAGGKSDRYSFNYQKGTLTVTERPAITITAASLTREYGEENPTFTYEVSGGELLGGEPVLACEATKDSPAGEYEITISAGTVKNLNRTLVAGKLTITKAPLTIKAADATKLEQDENPALSLIYSGFKNDDTAEVLTKQPTVATTVDAETPAGTYDITVSGGQSDRYEFAYEKGTFTVAERPAITLTARSFTREYGDENPTFTYSVEGTLLGGTPVVSCEATKDSPAGEYPILITEGTVKNWHKTLVAGTLIITKAPLTVKATDCVKIEQDDNPELTFTYSGFKNEDDASVLLQQPTVSTEATVDSHAGSYEIVVSGGESDRYEFIYKNGTLTVRQRDQIVISAVSCTREYGEENPVFEFTVDGEILDGAPVLTCAATVDSPAGEYPIEVEIGTVENYNYVLQAGTLTITKAPLTVAVQDAERPAYEENPEFQLVYTGFKNDDDESVLLSQPYVETDASFYSETGSYVLYVLGGESDRYSFSYVNGVLTVSPGNAIQGVQVDATTPVDVYTLSGTMVRSQATSLKGLPRGIYLVGGKKVTVR